jgi:DNA-binding NtrC family response regulator
MPYALRSPTRPATILIVDDEAQICDLLSRVLAKEGYQVRTARSGTEAMHIAKNEPIELTLLDLRLPDIDGIQTLRQLKKIDESIVVIMMTAYGALDTAREAMMWGAYDFITKPVDLEFLNQVIKEGLAEEKAQLARG